MHATRAVATLTIAGQLLLGCPTAWAVPPEAASLRVLSGEVALGTVPVTADSGEVALPSGSVLRTGATSSALVRFPQGSLVRLAPDSSLVMSDAHDPTLTVTQGRVFARPVGQCLIVQTAGARATANAGEFVLDVKGTQARLDVLSGDAVLQSQAPVTYPALSALKAPLQLQALLAGLGLGGVQLAGGPDKPGNWRTRPINKTKPQPKPKPKPVEKKPSDDDSKPGTPVQPDSGVKPTTPSNPNPVDISDMQSGLGSSRIMTGPDGTAVGAGGGGTGLAIGLGALGLGLGALFGSLLNNNNGNNNNPSFVPGPPFIPPGPPPVPPSPSRP